MTDFVQIDRITRSEFRGRLASPELSTRPGLFESQIPGTLLSPYLVERVVTTRSAAIPSCVVCGVCCLIPQVVAVSAREAERLPAYTEVVLDAEHESVVVSRFIPRSNDSRCVNLVGTFGKEVGCTVYEDRPKCCRDFEAGSDRCHEYRRMYGLDPQLTTKQVESAMAKLNVRFRPENIKDVSIVKAGTTVKTSISFGDEVERSESLLLKVFVLLNDESEHELHRYDPANEEWLETDFLGMSLDEARERICEKSLLEQGGYVKESSHR